MNALLSNPFKEGLRKGDTQIGLCHLLYGGDCGDVGL